MPSDAIRIMVYAVVSGALAFGPEGSTAAQGAAGGEAELDPLHRRPDVRIDIGPPVFPGREPGAGHLTAQMTPAGNVTILAGDGKTLLQAGGFFRGGGAPVTRETPDADSDRTVFRRRHNGAEAVQEVIVSPNNVWLLWTVRGVDEAGRAGLWATINADVAAGPYINYHAVNQQMIAPRQTIEQKKAIFDLVSGTPDDFFEFQSGSMNRPMRFNGSAPGFHERLQAATGQAAYAVVRCAQNPADRYPAQSWDRCWEERGIVSTLLADIVPDRFVIIPSRSTRYTLTGREMTLHFKYFAVDRTDREVIVDCVVEDIWGQAVATQSFSVKSAGKPFVQADLPVVCESNGSYRMEITYRCGAVERTRELAWTVIPDIPDTGVRPDSVFGGAMGWGEYLWTLAGRVGIKWNRGHCAVGQAHVANIMPEPGRYVWDRLDYAVAMQKKYDILTCPNINIGHAPAWVREVWQNGDFEAYRRIVLDEYVRPLIERYQGKFRWWEFGNEPYYQFRECPEKYAELLKGAYRIIKEVDPDTQVIGTCGPSWSQGFRWYRSTFEQGTLDFQDMVSCHLYMHGPEVGCAWGMNVVKNIEQLREVMRECGGPVLPIVDSETCIGMGEPLYRHPSHRYYMKLPDPEQYRPRHPEHLANKYFKVLTAHKLTGVKYSFHTWHGGVQYGMHVSEYDETPNPFLVTQAALAKHLETKGYVGRLDIGENGKQDMFAGLFREGEELVVTIWGPTMLENDWCEVALPVAADKLKIRDVFDNPLPLQGDGRATRLLVSGKAFFLLTSQVSEDDLVAAFKAAEVTRHIADADAGGAIRGTFGGEDPHRATASDWAGFKQIDLSEKANSSFRDEVADDGKGGWTDEGPNDMRYLPTGEWVIHGVPFSIIDPAANDDRSCIVLKGGPNPDSTRFPPKVEIPVNARISRLHFLQTITWARSYQPHAYSYVLHFRDGTTDEIPVRDGDSVLNWWRAADPPNAKMAWSGPGGATEQVRVWHFEYDVKHPAGAQAFLEKIEAISKEGYPTPVVIAVTGVYSN